MIYKRVAARLRAQDWLAITIELGIVIVGVFIGTWEANWNQERAAQRDTKALLRELGPELRRPGSPEQTLVHRAFRDL